jgi:hypothetical protein
MGVLVVGVLILVGVLVVGVLILMSVLVVGVLILMGVLVVGVLILMGVLVTFLAELDGLDDADGLEDGHAVGFGGLDHIEQAFLESGPIDDERIGLTDLGDLLGRGLESVGIGPHGHDRHDLELIANEATDHVTEDVGGHHDRWTVASRLASRLAVRGAVVITSSNVIIATAGSEHQGKAGEHRHQGSGKGSHHQPSP